MNNLQNLDEWKDLNSYKSFNIYEMAQDNNYILENSEGALSFLDSVISKPSESKILCACGCGQNIPLKHWHKLYPVNYINHHFKPNNLEFNKEQEQVLLGSLLGDGGVYYRNKTYNLKKQNSYNYLEAHDLKQEEYLLWKNNILHFNFKFDNKNNCWVNKTNNSFKQYRELFYPDEKKIVTREILDKLEPLGIAVWFMDDGCYDYRGKLISIATHCFGLEGNQIIQQYFKERFNIDCKINKHYFNYYISFNVENTKKFIEIVKSYVTQIPCMVYKIESNEEKMEQFRIKKNENRKVYYKNNKEKLSRISYKSYLKNKDKINKKNREYNLKNKETIKQQKKGYYLNNKEKILGRCKKNYIKNQKQRLLQKKEYYSKNKEKIQVYRKGYYLRNKNKIIENQRGYYKKNRDKILKQKKENYFKTLNKEEGNEPNNKN